MSKTAFQIQFADTGAYAYKPKTWIDNNKSLIIPNAEERMGAYQAKMKLLVEGRMNDALEKLSTDMIKYGVPAVDGMERIFHDINAQLMKEFKEITNIPPVRVTTVLFQSSASYGDFMVEFVIDGTTKTRRVRWNDMLTNEICYNAWAAIMGILLGELFAFSHGNRPFEVVDPDFNKVNEQKPQQPPPPPPPPPPSTPYPFSSNIPNMTIGELDKVSKALVVMTTRNTKNKSTTK